MWNVRRMMNNNVEEHKHSSHSFHGLLEASIELPSSGFFFFWLHCTRRFLFFWRTCTMYIWHVGNRSTAAFCCRSSVAFIYEFSCPTKGRWAGAHLEWWWLAAIIPHEWMYYYAQRSYPCCVCDEMVLFCVPLSFTKRQYDRMKDPWRQCKLATSNAKERFYNCF